MKGNCICGDVSFQINGTLPNMYQCHCTLCQKQSGAGSNAATIIPVTAFDWLSGEDKIKPWKKQSGFNSHFCMACGCPVPNLIANKYMWIPVGLLGEVNAKVVSNLCLSTKASWNAIPVTDRDYDGMPDDLDEFVVYLANH